MTEGEKENIYTYTYASTKVELLYSDTSKSVKKGMLKIAQFIKKINLRILHFKVCINNLKCQSKAMLPNEGK